VDGRDAPDTSDLFLLKHIWNSEDQAPIVEAIVQPELETFYRERPERRRVGAVGVGVEALAAEIDRIRQILTGGTALGDVQLFSQLSALNEIKSALAGLQDPRARELERRVQDLLDASFKTGRFANL
jgi:MoxR-like ATPase